MSTDIERGGEVRPDPDAGAYVASFSQMRFWFLDEMAAVRGAYNLVFGGRVREALDPIAVRAAAEQLAARHEALRTTLRHGDTGLIATAHRSLPPEVAAVDARGWSPQALRRAVTQFSQAPFALADQSPLRIGLFATGAAETILVLVVHHAAADFTSLEILLAELGALFRQSAGEDGDLPPPVGGLGDAAEAERAWLGDAAARNASRYWAAQLLQPPSPPAWPYPRQPGESPSREGATASYFFSMGRELVEAVKRYAHEIGVTPTAVLLGGWAALLFQLSGLRDSVIGVPVSTRSGDMANAVGCFINTLPLRVRTGDAATFRDFTLQAWEAMVGGLRHRRYPFNLIVRDAAVARDLSRTPLLQTMVVLQRPGRIDALGTLHLATEEHAIEARWGGMALTPFRFIQQEGQVDLTLEANDTERLFLCVLKSRCDRFPAAQLPATAERLERILSQGVAHPEVAITQR